MKKIALFYAVASMFFTVAFNVFAQDQAPTPGYQEGDLWQFRVTEKDFKAQSTKAMDGDYEVTYSRGIVKVGRPGGEELEVRQGGELIRMLAIPDDERQYLQFPLFVGKKWSTGYQIVQRKGKVMSRTAETSVAGMEEITTPAGTFRVFKIERYETTGMAGKGRKSEGKLHHWEYTYYYSAETRSIVKYHFDDGEYGGKREIELIKYGSGR